MNSPKNMQMQISPIFQYRKRNFIINHFALSQDSCLGGCGLTTIKITSPCPKTAAWGAVDRHYTLKCLNSLKKDSRTPGRALQRRRLHSYAYLSLCLVPRLVLGGLCTVNLSLCLGGCALSIYP